MCWRLSTSTFWRECDNGLFVANEKSVVRLDGEASKKLMAFLGGARETLGFEDSDVFKMLLEERMLTLEGGVRDFEEQALGHIRTANA